MTPGRPVTAVRFALASAAFSALLLTPLDGAGQHPTALPHALCNRVERLAGATLASEIDDLRRVAEIGGCIPATDRLIRRGGFHHPDREAGSFTARPLPATLLAVDRTAYPYDSNNGALWEGVGVSTSARLGARVELSILTVALQPELLYQENRDFDMRESTYAGYSPFASRFYATIDQPQRFGTSSARRLVPGDSYARVDIDWLAAGLSTESLWRGPATRYPILMSNSAGGFPHLFLGTARAVDIGIGTVRAELVWGRLTESDYFDGDAQNDQTRLLNLALVGELEWIPGLSVGLTRSYHHVPGGGALEPLLQITGLSSTVNRPGNELASVFGRWVLPQNDVEFYAEWAREDVLGRWAEFLQEPDHSQAYLLGFQKVESIDDDLSLAIRGEVVHLQEGGEPRPGSRDLPIYYRHGRVVQGYTHQGQLLGAGIGPGGSAQFLALDALFGEWTLGGYVERIRRNDESGAARALRRGGSFERDTELIAGVRSVWLRGAMAMGAEINRALRLNRDFEGNDVSWRTELQLSWYPDSEAGI